MVSALTKWRISKSSGMRLVAVVVFPAPFGPPTTTTRGLWLSSVIEPTCHPSRHHLRHLALPHSSYLLPIPAWPRGRVRTGEVGAVVPVRFDQLVLGVVRAEEVEGGAGALVV